MPPDPRPILPSSEELLDLCKKATGGERYLDAFGCIRLRGSDEHICHGDDHDVTWANPADALLAERMSPYVVHCLIIENDNAHKRCDAYCKLIRELGGDPRDAVKFL